MAGYLQQEAGPVIRLVRAWLVSARLARTLLDGKAQHALGNHTCLIETGKAALQIEIATAAWAGAKVKRQSRLVQGLHQRHLCPQGAQQGDQIRLGDRIPHQDVGWCWLPIGAGTSEQIFDRKIDPIGQFGERETELLEDRDAGIVAVEITPLIAAEAPQQLQRLSPQPGIAEGGMGVGVKVDRGGGDGHDRSVTKQVNTKKNNYPTRGLLL